MHTGGRELLGATGERRRHVTGDRQQVGQGAVQGHGHSTDFAVITHFDWSRWSCDYWASDATVLPTSDTPLHCALLLNTRRDMRWTEYPEVVLHGHAFETEAEAAACGYPISTEETLFSTRDDTDALMTLVDRFPYPQHDIFIRKAHGFLLLAGSTAAAKATFDARMKPHLI